jgi:hypothetical protein
VSYWVTPPVIFGGSYHHFRRALPPVVGLHSATGIDPNVVISIFESGPAGAFDFDPSSLTEFCSTVDISICDFIFTHV